LKIHKREPGSKRRHREKEEVGGSDQEVAVLDQKRVVNRDAAEEGRILGKSRGGMPRRE